jgi:hypothetical protein
MTAKKHHLLSVVLLIIVLCANLLNVQLVHADGETPTEPPVATQVETDTETEPLAEVTPVPVGTLVVEEGITAPVEVDPSAGTSEAASSQETVVSENTPVAVILSEVSPEADIVVLDQEGQPLVLSSQDAADALVTSDPVWCPANVSVPTPGANNCSISYASIAELLEAMRNNPAAFDEDGTIFLEKPAGSGFTTPLILDSSANSLGGSFATLSNFNLTIRGGWNGNNPGTFSSQTVFGASGGSEGYVLIGSQQNPWIGNVTLRDLNLIGISVANAVTVYTTSGNITLNNVDVDQQTGTNYTAYLDSDSGILWRNWYW